jgi:hypothetical protein
VGGGRMSEQEAGLALEPKYCEMCGTPLSSRWGPLRYDPQTGRPRERTGERSLMCKGYMSQGCFIQYFLRDGRWVRV